MGNTPGTVRSHVFRSTALMLPLDIPHSKTSKVCSYCHREDPAWLKEKNRMSQIYASTHHAWSRDVYVASNQMVDLIMNISRSSTALTEGVTDIMALLENLESATTKLNQSKNVPHIQPLLTHFRYVLEHTTEVVTCYRNFCNLVKDSVIKLKMLGCHMIAVHDTLTDVPEHLNRYAILNESSNHLLGSMYQELQLVCSVMNRIVTKLKKCEARVAEEQKIYYPGLKTRTI